MRTVSSIALAAGVVTLALSGPRAAGAAELKVMISNALKSTMEELTPQFEKASENKLSITFGAAAELKASIEKGEPVDAAILTTATTDDLVKEGKLSPNGRTDVARAGAGVAAHKGAPKPDISTSEAFKHALLDAKSIAFVEAGATAPYIKSLFDRLGIADQVKAKLKPQPTSNPAAKAVANGEAELGITQISEILPYASIGAELVGPLPPELQLYTTYPAAVATDSKQSAAAAVFIKFMTSPAAVAVLKAKGLSPG
ncbi:MAG TPA: molybdate ABC transporter substrate-binding protein [Xanthobacteraceae bacterium]|nr:molybdate ABC transporter substrate-binding protein [Xanthobacteraceae bacterium]